MNRQRQIGIIILLAVSIACASVPLKQRLVLSSQTVETVLGAAQDFERTAFQNSTIPGLDQAKHQAFAAALSKAFDAQIKLGTVLIAWHSGDPVPASLAELTMDVDEAFAVAQSLLPSGGQAADLVAKVQVVIDEALKLGNLVKGAN
jgi:hypothetical protein